MSAALRRLSLLMLLMLLMLLSSPGLLKFKLNCCARVKQEQTRHLFHRHADDACWVFTQFLPCVCVVRTLRITSISVFQQRPLNDVSFPQHTRCTLYSAPHDDPVVRL